MKKIILIIILIVVAANFYKNPAENAAYDHVKANSVIDFKLEKVFKDEKFAKYNVIPKEDGHDQAQIYLINNNGKWEAIAFGTSFEDLEKRYPELKGR